MDGIPFIPESAPFTPEQRAYLNGFFAGLFSRAQPSAAPGAGPPAPTKLAPIYILFGTQTGNAEALARRAAKQAAQQGFAPTVSSLDAFPRAQLQSDAPLLVIASTYGDGDPPDNARAFWEFLQGNPRLERVRYSLLALGDRNYEKFCAFGKNLDARFEQLGAKRISARVDCDVEYEAEFQQWLEAALRGMRADVSEAAQSPLAPAGFSRPTPDSRPSLAPPPIANYDRNRPFPARLITRRLLNGPGSEKETRHYELAIEPEAIAYQAGDALGVWPWNCSDLVSATIAGMACTGEEPVTGRAAATVSFREALLRHYDITRLSPRLIQWVAERANDSELRRIAGPTANGELTQFIAGRDLLDLVHLYPGLEWDPAELVGLLNRLAPRLYSIASSPKTHPGCIHLTVATVRYSQSGRPRKGVCSTYLADRVGAEGAVEVFLQPNHKFRPPTDGDRPVIMVGPGTGIAPFRAFLQERQAAGARGRNWLWFGDQREKSDYLYREELEAWQQQNLLTRLDAVFSRDQPEKVYVQHRMLAAASEIYEWLEGGAYFYVCGDARRMAKDVDVALHQIISQAGGRTPDATREYVAGLQAEQRYLRDVY